MEIFMRDLGFSATDTQLRISVAGVLHGPDYSHHRDTTLPINFAIYLHKRRGNVRQRTGVLTLPTVAIGNQFLQEFGGPTPRRSIVLGTKVDFRLSNKPPRPHIVEEIRRLPYDDPRAQEERDRQTDLVRSEVVSLRAIQFGWECRDNVFSIEWERIVDRCELIFDDERREFHIKAYEPSLVRFIAIRASHIAWTSAATDTSTSTTPAIFLSLNYPPNYETESTRNISVLMQALKLSSGNLEPEPRQRWTNFGNDHAEIAPYTSVAIRLLCRDQSGLKTYQRLCKFAHIKADEYAYPAERRNLFSSSVQAEYQSWLLQLAWPVAFQVEALTRGLLVDLREMLHLRRRILEMVRDKGATFTSSFLRHFATQAKTLFWYTDETYTPSGSVQDLYVRCEQDYTPPTRSRPRGPVPVPDIDIFECLHVTVTPTSMLLEGPYPERSNRIMRQYTGNHDSFLRVNFVDETQLQYRFDREVDGSSFIKRRVGKSALKEHAVWFVKEFVHSDGKVVNAATIIEGLGTFDGLVSDPKLIYCPARYGARISQAFTATDSSVTVEPEEIFELDDIHDIAGKWCFTDGVGTISGDLAREIWRTLSARRRGARKAQTYPRAFQIRFMGSKGMLSVDYRLTGRAICIRPSMIKFEAPSSLAIDIARAFYRPGPFYLNRQLIMILEALGVPYEVFAKLQRAAVRDAQESVNSLERSARLLETYGLGTSYRLTSVMLSLHKLGVEPLSEDPFWQKMMDFSVNHVLRELKYHARIPVPEAWNLVGVADIHGYLTEGEIFGCIVPSDGTAPIYLEGPTTVSRSPSIHPGDVQIARGIGKPPPGSPFERESLRNTLVFSVKGARPLPSCLGGGDLDGDEYRVTMLESLRPRRTYAPAAYDPAQKMLLDRPSTMQDVADFVTEYINSDSLGIIATAWLVIADQSSQGIFDQDCLTLSALHSDAVDYPKSGRPVPLTKIPKYKFRAKPDWNAPETVISKDSTKYYQSTKAIGRLYREIDLPAVATARSAQRSQRRDVTNGQPRRLDEVLEAFHDGGYYDDGEAFAAVQHRVEDHISIGRYDDDLVAEIWELFRNYISQLQTICADHSLSHKKDAMLTEEEAVVGSIVAQCSQPRKRKDLMSKLREQTTALVDDILNDLSGEVGTLPEKSLERAMVALRISTIEEKLFGAKSFAWIAMGEIFEAIKTIETSEGLF